MLFIEVKCLFAASIYLFWFKNDFSMTKTHLYNFYLIITNAFDIYAHFLVFESAKIAFI
jgi:hypothetical protein